MLKNDQFFDTNVLLYALSKTERDKADRAADLVREGGTISVQVLNEFTLVLRRKYMTEWSVVRLALQNLRESLDVVPQTIEVHLRGIEISERYGFGVYEFDDRRCRAIGWMHDALVRGHAGPPDFGSAHHPQSIRDAITSQRATAGRPSSCSALPGHFRAPLPPTCNGMPISSSSRPVVSACCWRAISTRAFL